jgi:hypothetical protein
MTRNCSQVIEPVATVCVKKESMTCEQFRVIYET